MTVVFDVIVAVVLVATSVLAGVQTYIRFNVLHAVRHLPQELGVRLHQELLTWRDGRINNKAGTAAGVGLVALLIVVPFASHLRETATLILVAAALVAELAYFGLVQRERPTNREINSWGTGPVPETYAHIRAEWDAAEWQRFALTWLGFACTVAAALINV